VLESVDSVAHLIAFNELNKNYTVGFTPLLHLLLPGDHITRIYLFNIWQTQVAD